jgi:hypothetical protein
LKNPISAGHRVALQDAAGETVSLAYNAQPFALRLSRSIQVFA